MQRWLYSNISSLSRTLSYCCFLILSVNTLALENSDSGFWIDGQYSDIDSVLAVKPNDLQPRVADLPLSGGLHWHYLPVNIIQDNPLVIDFLSTSVIGQFTHYIVNSENEPVARYQGGIRSRSVNNYFLRHGRDLDLPVGSYRIFTSIETPFLLAQPTPHIYAKSAYIQSIKIGNTITLLGLGAFLTLFIYYCVLGVTRRESTDYLYATFILGNLVFNSTALNVFSDLFGWTIFYSIGFPIMLSNIAYVAFVMALLGITKQSAPKLYKVGITGLVILASFWPIALFVPNLSLEFARYGVAIFGLYGLVSGVVMALSGLKIARYYLIVNIAFLIPAIFAIGLKSLPDSTVFIEHIGLLAVAIEVILISLVLSSQLSIVYNEKTNSLASAQEALEIADGAIKTKERFLANVSHELRTPLNAIQGAVDLIKYKSVDNDALEKLNIIRHSSSFLLFLINDILDLAKLNANMLTIENRPFNLRKMVSRICQIYGSSYTINSDTTFKLNIHPDVPTHIMGDKNRLEQVIANLLSNAFKFTKIGCVSVYVSVENGSVKFEITDTGIGIAEEKISSMFLEFTQADSSTSRKYGGTGLGLRISSKIIELMGGKIAAKSTLGKGSTFSFCLPIELVNDSHPVAYSIDNNPANSATFAGLRVLVIDDNTINLKVMEGLLERLSVTTYSLLSAKSVFEFCEDNRIDILIMDIQMPEVDGLMATKKLREQGFSKPIIAFTANASEEDQVECYRVGMNDMLIKPIRMQSLITVLKKWQGRRSTIS